jgi:hypothetical protein
MGFALQGKKDTMKDNCKKLNLRLEKAVSTQAPWPMPDASFRKYLLVDKVAASVMPLYSNVWREFEHNHFKMQQKYVKCVFLYVHLYTKCLEASIRCRGDKFVKSKDV